MQTIALNMICGRGEAGLLDRCLESMRAKENFDEVVIAVTADDPDVWAVAEKHATTVLRHEWATDEYPLGHFANARNAALDATTADLVMWCDADDVVRPARYAKFLEFIEIAKKTDPPIDIGFCTYDLAPIGDDDSDRGIFKERIWRRCELFRWRGAVHELILPFDGWSEDTLRRGVSRDAWISHMPGKAPETSSARNVAMMEAVYKAGNDDDHTLYFLSNDLVHLRRIADADAMVATLITRHTTSAENMYVCACTLAQAYAYGDLLFRPMYDNLITDNADKAEGWARVAMAMRPGYAEPYLILGDIYQARGEIEASGRMYKTAIKKQYGSGTNQIRPFYSELPAGRLSDLCYKYGDLEQALWYNKISARACNSDVCVERRQKIIHRIVAVRSH